MKHCFEALDKSTKDLFNDFEKPFGGMSVLLGGDFRQILPVKLGEEKEAIINASIYNSYLWSQCQILTLKQNMRLLNNCLTKDKKEEVAKFSEWILNIGNGTVEGIKDNNEEDTTWIQIPSEFIIEKCSDPIHDITISIYDELQKKFNNIEYLKERAIITPKNKTTEQINTYVLSLIPTESKSYYSCDSICSSSGNLEELNLLYPLEFLNNLNFNGLPPHELTLKIGAPIMLLRNLNQAS